MSINVDFHNSSLKNEIIDTIHVIQNAIAYRLPAHTEGHLGKLSDLIETVSTIYPSAIQDIERLKNLQTTLIHEIESLSTAAPIVTAKTIHPEQMKVCPPVGIYNGANNCGMNAIGQLLSSAPSIARKIFGRDPELKSLVQEIYEGQLSDMTVSESFGKNLRNWITNHVTGAEKQEWMREGNQFNTKQIDILTPLHTIFEKASFNYQFVQEIHEKNKKRELPEPDIQYSIGLDLSKGKRTFEGLFDDFFTDHIEGGTVKKLKFEEAPQDLVVTAWRFGFGGGQHKIQDPIRKVPHSFKLKTEYTKYNQDVFYELTGCIIHEGTLEGGHYTYLRKSGQTWYLINDATVTEVKDPTPYLEKGYVYHFKKTEAIADIPSYNCMDWAKWAVQQSASLVFQILSYPFQFMDSTKKDS